MPSKTKPKKIRGSLARKPRSAKQKKPERPLGHRQLIRTSAPMIRWLKAKKPKDIVAKNMWHNRKCLLATFFREHGHDFSVGGWHYGHGTYSIPGWFDRLFDALGGPRVTAQHALAIIAARKTQPPAKAGEAKQ